MNEDNNKIIYKELSYLINGFLFKAHHDLGRFRKEKQYGDYLEDLLKLNNLKYQREYRISTKTKVRDVVDFIIDDKIILELKVVDFLTKDEYYQVQRYLESLNLKLGIIVNFRSFRLVIKRVLNNKIEL
jgi:GxxExxY protein